MAPVVSMNVPTALQAYSSMLAIKGTRVHYYDAGDLNAPVMVLIHGLGDEADTWQHIIPALAERYRVLALDLPGFGRSEQTRRSYSTGFFANIVAGMLDELKVKQAIIVGSSMGAMVSQRLAMARPDLVKQLVLIGGTLSQGKQPINLGTLLFLIPGVGEIFYSTLRASQDKSYETLRPYYYQLDQLPEAQRNFLRDRVWARVWSAGQRRGFLSTLRWMVIDTSLRMPQFMAGLAKLNIPTLLVWGDHDNIMPIANAEAILKVMPNARLVVLPETGHLPQQETPQAVIDLLLGL